jgi:itaconyl-CoA hydratase
MTEKLPPMLTKISDKHYKENIGLYFEDFVEGATYESKKGRTVVYADTVWMTMLLGIQTDIHINKHAAEQSEFGSLILDQIIVFGISVGLEADLISNNAAANLEFTELKALHPVRIGDTLYVSTEILSKRESHSRPKQGIVKAKIITKNQDDIIIHTGIRTILVWKREPNRE